MKQITIAGNITRDAELRTTQQGDKVTGFSVAVNDRNKQATFFDCSLWGRRGEALAQYLTKGSRVCVSGDLSTHEHNGKTYLKVNASEVTLMGGNSGDREPRDDYNAPQQGKSPASIDFDDDLPF
jgi:single-strand DNA-binding protein